MKDAKPIRALVVDDEPLAREIIREMIRRDTEISIIGECGNGMDAVTMIETERPDMVFLDIQMPEMDGFAVIEAVGAQDYARSGFCYGLRSIRGECFQSTRARLHLEAVRLGAVRGCIAASEIANQTRKRLER